MKKPVTNVVTGFFYGGEQGIRTLETALTVYTISNRAPSASSDNSPYREFIIPKEWVEIKIIFTQDLILHRQQPQDMVR